MKLVEAVFGKKRVGVVMARQLEQALDSLDVRTIKVLDEFFEPPGMGVSELAKHLGISKQRVYQIKYTGLNRLRRLCTRSDPPVCLDDLDLPAPLEHALAQYKRKGSSGILRGWQDRNWLRHPIAEFCARVSVLDLYRANCLGKKSIETFLAMLAKHGYKLRDDQLNLPGIT